MPLELNREHLLGQQIAFEQLATSFRDTVHAQMTTPNAVALYAFLLEVLDQVGMNADLTIPEFMAWAQRVFEERFGPAKTKEE